MENIPKPNRAHLNFASVAEGAFAFLADFGFSQVGGSPTIVRYRKGNLEANVYHGRQSYELDFEIVCNEMRYSLGELIRAANPEAEKQHHSYAATTESGIKEGLVLLRNLAKRYGKSALRGDPEYFELLEKQRKSWSIKYSLDVLEHQLRPKAQKAFRLGNYRDAAELYEQIRSRLTPSELKKLAFARKRTLDN